MRGSKMPRRAVDETTELRVTLGTKEREYIESLIRTQQANVGIDGVTATLQAAGTALGGAGFLYAAIALAAWFGFDPVKKAIEKTGNGIADWMSVVLFDQPLSQHQAEWDAINELKKEVNLRQQAVNAARDAACSPEAMSNASNINEQIATCSMVIQDTKAEQDAIFALKEAIVEREARHRANIKQERDAYVKATPRFTGNPPYDLSHWFTRTILGRD